MTRDEKPDSGNPSRSSATGTNHYRHTRVEQSRVARLYRDKDLKGIPIRTPSLDLSVELRTVLSFAGLLISGSAVLAALLFTKSMDPESAARLSISFALGLTVACAISSSLAFLIKIRHWLLLLALMAGLSAAAAIWQGWGPLESLAKVVFATSAGLWIALMLSSIAQVLLICALVIVVDIWSVFMGPTKIMVESGGPWIDYLTINLPVFGADAVSRLGASDIIFFSIFVGCTLLWHLRRTLTALALTLSFVSTMLVGISLEIGVPALPLLSIFFLLANADLLYLRFLAEPDENRRDRGNGSEDSNGDGRRNDGRDGNGDDRGPGKP